MKKLLFTSLLMILSSAANYVGGANFDDNFDDETLRINVSVRNNGYGYPVSIDSIAQWKGWYGRRANLTHLQYPEEMRIYVIDSSTSDTIFVDGKSPDVYSGEVGEKQHVSFFVPKPKNACSISVVTNDYSADRSAPMQQVTSIPLSQATLSSLRSKHSRSLHPFGTIRKAADPRKCINIALLSEGYTAYEMVKFINDAQRLDSALFTQPGFKENASSFNVVWVMLPSVESGISIPSQNKTVDSALGAHFDSYGMERLVTIPDTWVMWDALECTPTQFVMILANTDKYGGSGGFNEYAIASAGDPNYPEIIIHEFGHSFGWLGDEYEAGYVVDYTPDFEPLEPNITTMHDFSGKWQNLIDSGEASLIEGAGYQAKGVWRGCPTCIMRSITDKTFCPVCAQALSRSIRYFTGE